MNFVAMDFETASAQRHSACSLALTVVRNNAVVDEFYTLIKPDVEFSWRNTQIHGIHASDVADAPTFSEVWPHIQQFYTNDQLVVAHNAPFDNGVLKSSLDHFGFAPAHYLTLDTVKTSRRFFPDFPNHKLNTVSERLHVNLEHHHNALDDSLACANILIYQDQQFGAAALKPFVKLT
ncbi:3'-5' exonuclease [Furfurilactobacillus siliginis]|uniref:DNA polymerase III polC-type n=1 Tax=Furfurilactobacillus siliginis TaxID=348151 RepID=A0A0R2L5L7_9LACO|nr:3'-5' exonuclease [Furfurilactobacillus siliginis]KRN96656.1 DNA polymerase III, epsilon subunit related 3-5 exonuclease [Furfurilactobacillus siliginis]GEK29360.1 exonuclease [Furfurilactobacillus siliginis]